MKSSLSYVVFLAGWILFASRASGIPIEDLDLTRSWRVKGIEISGNKKFSASQLRDELLTKARPWYQLWEELPTFDPVTFREDLERLKRFYESRGYYETRLQYDLEADREHSWLIVRMDLVEGEPVIVSEVELEVSGGLLYGGELPIKEGEIFNEADYRGGAEALQAFFFNHGRAYVETQRKAEVNLERKQVRVWYHVVPGPLTVFGQTTVDGTQRFDPQLVLRELAYRPGESFSLQKISDSRDKIVALDLFTTVAIGPKKVQGMPEAVPIEVQVAEKEPRELRASVGYGTEDQFRAQLEWHDNNWFGGGRRLSVVGKYSSIAATGAINLIQPHFLSPRTRGVLTLRHDREDEETYLLNATRFNPRLEHRLSEHLSIFGGYRLEYSKVDNVAPATRQALGGIRERGLRSGPGFGLIWDTSNDPLTPTKGQVVSFQFDQAGAIWGGEFSFYKMTAEAKKYLLLGWETVLAGRLKLGFADSLGSKKNLPVFERFFSGGEKSVRGFGRRRLGPLSAANDPIGGLSLLEGSVELRRPIWGSIGGALFVDFGQVSTRSFNPPVDDLKFSAGFGLNYKTPVGPLRLDIGFPFEPPRGDRPWQVHFSVGAYF